VADEHQEWFSGTEMLTAHNMFRREIGLIPALIRPGVTPGHAKVIGDHFALVAGILHHHHSIEDEFVWPLLLERTRQSALAATGKMAAQHQEIAAQLKMVGEQMQKWSTGDASVTDITLSDDLAELVDSLEEHLRAEEEHVVPLMEQHITAAEWDQMLARGLAEVDPTTFALVFGMMLYEGDPAVVDRAIANMPVQARPGIREAAARAFADHASCVFGTANPPRVADI